MKSELVGWCEGLQHYRKAAMLHQERDGKHYVIPAQVFKTLDSRTRTALIERCSALGFW